MSRQRECGRNIESAVFAAQMLNMRTLCKLDWSSKFMVQTKRLLMLAWLAAKLAHGGCTHTLTLRLCQLSMAALMSNTCTQMMPSS